MERMGSVAFSTTLGSFFGASFFSAVVDASAFGKGGAAGMAEAGAGVEDEAEADAEADVEAAAAAAALAAAVPALTLLTGLGGSLGLLWMFGMVNSS
jgi:hypothetical protein